MIKQISCSFPVPFNGKMEGEGMLMKMIPDGKRCFKVSLERNANFHPALPSARIPSLCHVNNYRSQQSLMIVRNSYRTNIQWKALGFSCTLTGCWVLEEEKVTTGFQSSCIHKFHIESINSLVPGSTVTCSLSQWHLKHCVPYSICKTYYCNIWLTSL